MKQIQFIGVTPTDLLNEMDKRIATLKKELLKELQPKEPTELLTRDEVCSMLKINRSTLHRWTRKGAFYSYPIEGRVYYKRNELNETLNKYKTGKNEGKNDKK